MPLRSFLFLILFTLLLACKSGSDEIESPQTDPLETSVQWNDFVTFKTGNIPLIIVAPHGGDLKPQWIDDRGCPDSKLLQDQYTLGIALQIEQELNAMGYQPYMVLAKMHRIKIDLNRSRNTALCEDKTAVPLWELFHNQITAFQNDISTMHGRGILIDLHGQSHPEQRIELGYLLNGSMLRDLEQNATDYSNQVSIKNLISNHPNQTSFQQLLVGENSLGTLLSEQDFAAVPSQSDQAPLESQLFFSGGHNTINYGSRDSGTIDAIQVELNRVGLRAESDDRQRFANVFSNVIIDYLTVHYSDAFTP
jgi:N-formylglutamate amidohydrolase